MTDLWKRAAETVLEHEGGYVNDPADPGGATNWGVSLRFLKLEIELGRLYGDNFDFDGDGDVDAADIKMMPQADALEVYKARFWTPYGWDRFHPSIAIKAFDLGVNMGPRQAIKLLQRACRACGEEIADDGAMGPITAGTVRGLGEADAGALLAALRSEAAGFYRALIAARPAFDKYRRGWIRRAYA